MQSIGNKPVFPTQQAGSCTTKIAGKNSRTTATYPESKYCHQVSHEFPILRLRSAQVPNSQFPIPNSQLLFIDSRVENWEKLAKGARAGTEVFLLESTRDGVEQITSILANYSDLDSLQIVSHGRPAGVQIGSLELNSDNLETYSYLLQQWGKALSERGNILLFGCSIAAGESGRAFVRRLSEIAGADMVASEDLTGNVALGGDWELEFATGEILRDIAIEKEVLKAYGYVLLTYSPPGRCGDS